MIRATDLGSNRRDDGDDGISEPSAGEQALESPRAHPVPGGGGLAGIANLQADGCFEIHQTKDLEVSDAAFK